MARVALLGVLGVVLTLYVSPLSHWMAQSRTADEQRAEVDRLQREHDRLSGRAQALRSPGATEREARKLGMVRLGERAYVIELP